MENLFAHLTPEEQEEALELLAVLDRGYFPGARDKQLPPAGDWHLWLFLAGRGWGKTRTGAEWLVDRMLEAPGLRGVVVAETFGDARDVCVEGESGIKAVLDRREVGYRWNRSLGEVLLENGSTIKIFGAEEPDKFRGYQFHYGWFDELASWPRLRESWDMLALGMRLGERPRVCITTTPRPIKVLREIAAREDAEVVKGSTLENEANLAPTFKETVLKRYEGTKLGRQEINGEILDDEEGLLFGRGDFRYWSYQPAAEGLLWRLGDRLVRPDEAMKFATVDLAGSVKTTADFSVIAVWALDAGDLILLDLARHRLEEGAHFPMLRRMKEKWALKFIGIEKGFYGSTAIQQLVRQDRELIIVPLSPDTDKVTRALPASELARANRLWFPSPAEGDVPWLEDYEQELVEFPTGDHDDCVDVTSYAAKEFASRHILRAAKKADPTEAIDRFIQRKNRERARSKRRYGML